MTLVMFGIKASDVKSMPEGEVSEVSDVFSAGKVRGGRMLRVKEDDVYQLWEWIPQRKFASCYKAKIGNCAIWA